MDLLSLACGIMIGLAYAYLGLVVVVSTEDLVPDLAEWVDDSCSRGIAVLVLWAAVLPFVGLRAWFRRRAR